MRTRLLASLLALLAAAAVLVGDSAGPTCEIYKGWSVDVTYETDCGPGDKGAFSASTGDLAYDVVGPPQADDVLYLQTAGAMDVTILSISYDTSACEDRSGQGRFAGLVLEIAAGTDTGTPTDTVWQCANWDAGSDDQSLKCYPSTGGTTCTLTLTAVAT